MEIQRTSFQREIAFRPPDRRIPGHERIREIVHENNKDHDTGPIFQGGSKQEKLLVGAVRGHTQIENVKPRVRVLQQIGETLAYVDPAMIRSHTNPPARPRESCRRR
jgi:hypothetical protein